MDAAPALPGPGTKYWGICSHGRESPWWSQRKCWKLTDEGSAFPINVIEFTRSPHAFDSALEEDPILSHCSDQVKHFLPSEGSSPNDAKVFIDRHLVPHTLRQLSNSGVLINGKRLYWNDLKCRHVVCSDRFWPIIMAAVSSLPGRFGTRAKAVGVISSADDHRVVQIVAAALGDDIGSDDLGPIDDIAALDD